MAQLRTGHLVWRSLLPDLAWSLLFLLTDLILSERASTRSYMSNLKQSRTQIISESKSDASLNLEYGEDYE